MKNDVWETNPAPADAAMSDMPDARVSGDWRAWFAENGPRLRLIARNWTRSDADADDVVQEAFIRFW